MFEASYQLQNCSRTEHRIMASANYRGGMQSLSNTPSPGGNDHPMVLVGCCMPWRRLGVQLQYVFLYENKIYPKYYDSSEIL